MNNNYQIAQDELKRIESITYSTVTLLELGLDDFAVRTALTQTIDDDTADSIIRAAKARVKKKQ